MKIIEVLNKMNLKKSADLKRIRLDKLRVTQSRESAINKGHGKRFFDAWDEEFGLK